MEARVVDLMYGQCVELEDLLMELLRVNRHGKRAVMLALVSPGKGMMQVKIFDNAAARAMAEIMEEEEEMKAYCNKCKKTTSQYMDGNHRVCGSCGRKVTVK